ncbi:MAG TPA: sodium:proline symporter, partial [Verrucomicrobiales bacterium]|nr:sodium:proline symporter [Verrucomicrobiales bacterium]
MTPLIIIVCYLGLLLALGIISSRSFRGTSKDYFVASHSIGPFLLLMSVFGTTMTAFALVGSTGKAFERGIGVYGLMASISGLVHAAVFFLIGIRLWVYGKKYGFVTQIQFFRARFDSQRIGYVLFPILAMLVVPYLLIGIIGAGKTVLPVTAGAFPDLFPNAATPQWAGGIPVWLTGLVICGVVMTYGFLGGSR